MTALWLKDTPDGKVHIEAFDYRTTTFYEEYCLWVTRASGTELRPNGKGEDGVTAYLFDWEGTTFLLSYCDEYGCYVEADQSQEETLVKFGNVLAETDDPEDEED